MNPASDNGWRTMDNQRSPHLLERSTGLPEAKMVSSIRAALLKGLSNGDPVYAATEDTVKELKDRIGQIHTTLKESASGTGISPARPKAYAINHATAYGGRESVKLLLALLDEEALAPPCRNKAELLTEDQAVLSGTEGSWASAFSHVNACRSPEAPSGMSPQPLRNRVQSQQGHVKPKCGRKPEHLEEAHEKPFSTNMVPVPTSPTALHVLHHRIGHLHNGRVVYHLIAVYHGPSGMSTELVLDGAHSKWLQECLGTRTSTGTRSLYSERTPDAPSQCGTDLRRQHCGARDGPVSLIPASAWDFTAPFGQAKERVVRSQFACTYQDDGLPLNRVLDFPSSSQLPTCVHPAPKRPSPAAAAPEEQADAASAFVGMDPEAARLALGQRIGNACVRTGGPARLQTVTKTSKRKLASRDCADQGSEENQPPQKRPPAKASNPGPAKKSSRAAGKKLIAANDSKTIITLPELGRNSQNFEQLYTHTVIIRSIATPRRNQPPGMKPGGYDSRTGLISVPDPPDTTITDTALAAGCTTQDYMHTDRYHDCP
ncbi:hypothetical protein NFI96_005160 [Prochilodus magdalenae]|nr:hypothetical protein NFI96_005160 [Prochilodus magdalenae]